MFADLSLAQPYAPSPITKMKMCEGATAVPGDWITTDEQIDQVCSFPPSSSVTGRMLTIETLKSLGTSAQFTICADAPVPIGYVVVAFGKVAGKCNLAAGDPNLATGNNFTKTLMLVPPSSAKKKKPTD
jgi:hypothetical protein